MTDIVTYEARNRIALITLNRPERLNAISRPMLNELSAKMVEANKDPEVRCIVLTGLFTRVHQRPRNLMRFAGTPCGSVKLP